MELKYSTGKLDLELENSEALPCILCTPRSFAAATIFIAFLIFLTELKLRETGTYTVIANKSANAVSPR